MRVSKKLIKRFYEEVTGREVDKVILQRGFYYVIFEDSDVKYLVHTEYEIIRWRECKCKVLMALHYIQENTINSKS